MNRFLITVSALAVLTLVHCKSSKTTATTESRGMFSPDEKQMAVATTRWPGTAKEDVIQGHTIFNTKCNQCHKPFEITRFSEKKWLHEIDEMAPKAKLTAEEKQQLTKHILSYREAFASASK